MSMKDPMTKYDFMLATGAFFTVVLIAFMFIYAYFAGVREPRDSVLKNQMVNTQVVLDCNRPEGHKVWKVDSIIFYKGKKLSLYKDEMKETVDAANWLCSIGSEVVRE